MIVDKITFLGLNHQSPEFDAAYDVISRDISPEYLETREFLKNRLRVREEGPKTEREKLLVQDGYTLHLIAARDGEKVVGAVYGHLISKIATENRGIGFATYISVHPEYRRQGIGACLIEKLRKTVDHEALRITGKPIIGMVYEIEEDGKKEIKGVVRKHHGWPLDIVYFQPALRAGYERKQMTLWYQSFEPAVITETAAKQFKLPVHILESLVRNMLVMEYVGPEMKGFDLSCELFTEFKKSLGTGKEIGFLFR